jgi:hypothetical protein
MHVSPLHDQIEHDTSTEQATCVCGPETRPVKCDDGSVAWVIVHHSLDGREHEETDR